MQTTTYNATCNLDILVVLKIPNIFNILFFVSHLFTFFNIVKIDIRDIYIYNLGNYFPAALKISTIFSTLIPTFLIVHVALKLW